MRPVALLVPALLAAAPLHAQFWSTLANPRVDVRLVHPPALDVHLERIGVAPSDYDPSRELADLLVAEFLRQRVDVLDAGRIRTRDGRSLLVQVDVQRMHARRNRSKQDGTDSKGKPKVTYTATTTVDFTASVQIIEPGTSRVLATKRFEEAPTATVSAVNEVPPHPPEGDLRRAAQGMVMAWLMPQVLPWDEVLKVTFFDDDAYKMDKAAARFKDGDVAGGLEWAARGEAEARSDPGGKAKFRERVIYNLGVARMVAGDFAGARPRLQEARDMNPDASIFRDTLKDCMRALELQEERRRWERSVPQAAPPPAQPQPRPQAQPAQPSGTRSPEQRLRDLDSLRQKGLVTEEEYRRRREEILREI